MSKYGYKHPTPVQEKAIKLVLSGINVVISAPTGSGKTEAAMFPVFSKIVERGTLGRQQGIKALYITPMKSLNRDIFNRMQGIASELGIRLVVRHGDTGSQDRRAFLENPPDIAVMTPETFYFMLSVPKFRANISLTRFVIVDEAHELLSSKRGAEFSLALERALRLYIKRQPQLIALSATIENPLLIIKYIFNGRPAAIVDLTDKLQKEMRVVVATIARDLEDSFSNHVAAIANYIREEKGNVLVFTNTRDSAEAVAAALRRTFGDSVSVHHSSLSKDVRMDVEQKLKQGELRVVVATSSLELGIDIGNVALVIQYLSPRQAVKLVQRVGRSGHRWAKVSRGVIITSKSVFDILESAVLARRAAQGDIEKLDIETKPLDALIHQIVGATIELKSIKIRDAYMLATSSKLYEDLGFDEFKRLLQEAAQIGVISINGDEIKVGRNSLKYYYSITMIPDTKSYKVYEIGSRRFIGNIDEDFAATLEVGSTFVLAGSMWEVIGFDSDRILVRQAESSTIVVPSWEGELIPVSYNTAREVGSILRRLSNANDEKVLAIYPLSSEAQASLIKMLHEHRSRGLPLPHDKLAVIEHYGDTYIVYSFLGSRGNKALEYALQGITFQTLGVTPLTSSTPYAVVVKFPYTTPPDKLQKIIELLAKLDENAVEDLVRQAVLNSRLMLVYTFRAAQRMGFLSKDTTLEEARRLVKFLANTVAGEEAFREIKSRKIDLQILLNFLKSIREGRIQIKTVSLREPSPLASSVIRSIPGTDRIRSSTLPTQLLVEAVRRRIEEKEATLLCVLCGSTMTIKIRRIDTKPKCPMCRSQALALIPPHIDVRKARNVVLKARKLQPHKEKLNAEERKLLAELMERANLVLTYGKRAIEALSFRGVGVHTAKTVLRRLFQGEHEFYKALIEAEANFHRYSRKLERRNVQTKH
ncbi:MAG: DEAD/DEAH box helicase [Thermoproteota archaeon]